MTRELKDNATVGVGEADVSLLVLVLRDINGLDQNSDLEFLEHDLRGYLKCLVQVRERVYVCHGQCVEFQMIWFGSPDPINQLNPDPGQNRTF